MRDKVAWPNLVDQGIHAGLKALSFEDAFEGGIKSCDILKGCGVLLAIADVCSLRRGSSFENLLVWIVRCEEGGVGDYGARYWRHDIWYWWFCGEEIVRFISENCCCESQGG